MFEVNILVCELFLFVPFMFALYLVSISNQLRDLSFLLFYF